MSAEPKVAEDGTISTPGAVDFFRVVNAQVSHVVLIAWQDPQGSCLACALPLVNLSSYLCRSVILSTHCV